MQRRGCLPACRPAAAAAAAAAVVVPSGSFFFFFFFFFCGNGRKLFPCQAEWLTLMPVLLKLYINQAAFFPASAERQSCRTFSSLSGMTLAPPHMIQLSAVLHPEPWQAI